MEPGIRARRTHEASHIARRARTALVVAFLAGAVSAATAIGCGGGVELTPETDTSEQGFCAKQCEVPADCCPDDTSANAPACPDAYPRNWGCEEGLCVAPRCAQDADCTLGACRAIDGSNTCVRPCSTDADCEQGLGGLGATTCAAAADDGTTICGGEIPACKGDDDCLDPASHCLASGRCGCRDDGDCAEATFKTCRGGTCSCGSDAACGPELDVCTTDWRHGYPPSAGAAPRPGGKSGSTGPGR